MQPIAFCNRCRGMKVGWNRRYVLHSLVCRELISKSCKLLILTAVIAIFMFVFQAPTEVVLSSIPQQPLKPAVVEASPAPLSNSAIEAVDSLLASYRVDPELRPRVAAAIVASSRKYNIEPRLVASIMIVESRANPFAVSEKDSIGIMQIHLPTWGQVADKQGLNLFKIEDNVDLGVRILKEYVAKNGVWEGVMRYRGFTATPASQQSAWEYVQKVQRIYGIEPEPMPGTAPLETATD